MLLALLLLAFADSPTPRLIAAPKLGLFEPTSRLSGALMLGAEFGYLTPALDDRLAVVLEVDWVRPRADGTITDPRSPRVRSASAMCPITSRIVHFRSAYRYPPRSSGTTSISRAMRSRPAANSSRIGPVISETYCS